LSILKEVLAKRRGGNWKIECVINEKAPEVEVEREREDRKEKREEQLSHNHKSLMGEVIDLFSGVLVDYSLSEEIAKGGWEDAELEKSDEGAQKMQAKIAKMQEELKEKTVEASSGGGMVKVVCNGQQEIIDIEIEPELLEEKDVEMLQDLVLAAVNEALRRSREIAEEEMGKITGG